ncbi:MAG: hypothetical protein JWN25_2713 [Verrucomicrobiales bacterium]|nr:hypothetical protein [Verrucomicrobiales bacterium]
MPKQTWIIATILSALVVIGFIGTIAWQNSNELELARQQIKASKGELEKTATQNAQLVAELVAEKEKFRELQAEKENTGQAQKSLEDEMRAALESKDVTISQLQGKLTVNILDRILFDSGEAVLKTEGDKVLAKIASVLTSYTNRQIHVVGHTDNVPIRPNARSRYASNWELSTARATAAVRFLVERAGVDPKKIGALGYGEFHPVADNSTSEGKAKNRRIEVVILPEELVPGHVLPPPVSPLKPATNTQPETLTPGD